MTATAQGPVLHLSSDRFAIRAAVTAIRNACTESSRRAPAALPDGERRTSLRVLLDVPVRLVPAAIAGEDVSLAAGLEGPIPARSRDISLGGIGLAHATALPGRQAIVVFDLPADDPIGLAVELAWSHAAPDGSQLSGARIVGLVNPVDLTPV